jgi:hypothetical protein
LKYLPLLAGALIIALIWAERRSGKRGNAAIGTAPAGAPPMREREPATPTAPRPTPYAPSATTSGAATWAGTPTAQPEPIAEADAPGSLPPEELATAGPDMETWVTANVGDTDTAEEEETATTAEADDTPAEQASELEQQQVPTPAEESTAVAAGNDKDWISADGARTCPDEFPIKGNASSRIYHLPGESTYEATIPEICFATEEAAVGLGYRARKR